MRTLSCSETELVSGGSPEIVVIANPQTMDPFGDYTFPPWFPPPLGFNSGYGQGAVDRSSLSPDASMDLSDTESVTYRFDGHEIEFILDNKDLPYETKERTHVIEALDKLYRSYDGLDAAAKNALRGMDNVVFTDVPNRSFSQENTATFFYDTTELLVSSSSFAASNMIHDANHIQIFQQTGDLHQSRGTASEISGWQLQINNAAALGLTAAEVTHLQGLVNNPAGQGPRVNQPPY